ncbi:bifunctional DNA primase/polymerase [Cryobacterium sp. TMT1-2-2]|uniref:bifunctional DNA primase/polymerase n=1 Tax=Cryobacterium sp. TMT1-2-2 TaxID=1259233 RepID=UPI00141BC6C7|nr:bifunctional DNA primase/polymerase [Cryobacterium sp. TMT1-2-2]
MSVPEVLVATNRLSVPDAALEFVRAGIPVFPCVPEGKHPLTSAGFHDASLDVDQVQAWWTRWPAANIGMPTGSTSGVDVVDIDVTKTDVGFAAFERASTAGLVDGELARVRTPSGGMHVYFVAIADRPQRCWQAAAAHIDFRGDGGYVVVPPSTLATDTGRASYRLYSLSTADPKPVDAVALRRFIDPRPPRTGTRATSARAPEPSRLAQWVSNLQEGERNSGLFWAACRLVETGLAPADVEAVLGPSAQTAGLDEREILATITSASRRATAGAQAFDRADPVARRNDLPCLS